MFPNYALGADSQMDAIIYGEHHPNTLNYLQSQFNTFTNTLHESALSFFNRGKELFEKFNGSEAIRFARNVVKEVLGTTDVRHDVVQSIFELERFQEATLTNIRYLMANPVCRDLFHQQRIDGWSHLYVDVEPGCIGNDHYDYRKVMDGVLQIEEDNWKFVHYLDQLKEGDRELMLEEKTDILSNWTALEALIEIGKDDPTSIFGDML